MSADNEPNANHLSDVNRLIHEPTRYNIMALLYVVDRAEFLFVQNQLGLTPGNLSAHISKLEAAHYLEIKKKFAGKIPRTFLRLTRLGRIAFEEYRRRMRELFTSPIKVSSGDGPPK